ncbi:MAG: TfoX/Sxy family protein [Candidatus Cloacimonetes bacterium]|nr:TfoX/Sxy family protein [Candidatus Cloacimonadota bacterium]
MSSTKETVDYILDQLSDLEDIHVKMMFGEYGIYQFDKMFGMVCDNQLFIKPTVAGRAFWGEAEEGCPYPGSKPWFYVSEERWDDEQWLQELVLVTLPEVLPVKKKTKKA